MDLTNFPKLCPTGSQGYNVVVMEELLVFLRIQYLHDITKYDRLVFVAKVNEKQNNLG